METFIELYKYTEAMKYLRWTEAIQQEVDPIKEKDTWKLADLLEGKTPISPIWIFKAKPGPSGKNEKLKARLVAQGFEQEEGIDFFETFALVV